MRLGELFLEFGIVIHPALFGVHQDDFIHGIANRMQASLQNGLLIAHNHTQTDGHHRIVHLPFGCLLVSYASISFHVSIKKKDGNSRPTFENQSLIRKRYQRR